MKLTSLILHTLGAAVLLAPVSGFCAPAAAPAASPAASAAAAPSQPAKASAPAKRPAGSVYSNQPEFTEKELLRFAEALPQFRAWARAQGEKAHPSVRSGQPDFTYSRAAADWVVQHGWDEQRFFCVMGRAAAALATVTSADDKGKAAKHKDMPSVTQNELSLVQKHLGELLKAGSDDKAPQMMPQTAPRTLPNK